MNLYTGGSSLADKKSKARTSLMREAADTDEGFMTTDLNESAAIEKLHRAKWDDLASTEQNTQQMERVRFADELRPIPYLLRTKRSKRCPICRHIISKPEQKISNTRFRIRLVAGSYIPSISIRPLLSSTPTIATVPSTPRMRSIPEQPQEQQQQQLLTPLKPVQYLLKFQNPIFESVKVTLATPATTPGRFASTVTVLCPQFEIDANTDMWDDALKDDTGETRRRRGEEGGLQQAEAGKIWERGRNWVSIVVEVVPASLRLDLLATHERDVDTSPLKEDEDLLEIPMFVRVEWEAEAQHDVGSAPGKDKEAREKRELAYWCVLGIGRISQD
jgi:dynactin 4